MVLYAYTLYMYSQQNVGHLASYKMLTISMGAVNSLLCWCHRGFQSVIYINACVYVT